MARDADKTGLRPSCSTCIKLTNALHVSNPICSSQLVDLVKGGRGSKEVFLWDIKPLVGGLQAWCIAVTVIRHRGKGEIELALLLMGHVTERQGSGCDKSYISVCVCVCVCVCPKCIKPKLNSAVSFSSLTEEWRQTQRNKDTNVHTHKHNFRHTQVCAYTHYITNACPNMGTGIMGSTIFGFWLMLGTKSQDVWASAALTLAILYEI